MVNRFLPQVYSTQKIITTIDSKYRTNQTNFEKISGSPIGYWASQNLIHDFEIGTPLGNIVDARHGLTTADNKRFLRQWFEVSQNTINFTAKNSDEAVRSGLKWFPYNKGGAYRKWYGNYDYVVNWHNDGYELKHFMRSDGKQRSVIENSNYYFREAITWSLITSGGFSMRYREPGSIHDVSGMSAFSNSKESLLIIMGIMNSKIGNVALKILNPTINSQVGDVTRVPVLKEAENSIILSTVEKNIELTKTDWDSFETSWDFKTHVLLRHIAEHPRLHLLKTAYYKCYVPNLRQFF